MAQDFGEQRLDGLPDGEGPPGAVDVVLQAVRPGRASGLERRLGIAAVLDAVGTEAKDRRVVGRLEVEEKIGEGGMGVVYRAYDPKLDRTVAVKLLRADADSDQRARVRDEARALAQLASPHVVTLYDMAATDDDVYLTMEFVEGAKLSEWLVEHRDASWREVLERFLQAGRGLDDAHRAGVVHRDFKPENVLVGNDGRVRVVDFGLARVERLGEIPQALSGGTPYYLAPEVRAGAEGTSASDQFSYCLSLARALDSARRPVGWAPPPSGVKAIVGRGLRDEPASRWPSMAELLDALEQSLNSDVSDRLRDVLLERVESLWLKSILRDSLDGENAIALPVADASDQVEPPWSQWAVIPGAPIRNTNELSTALDRGHGSLLILGEPGGGKTTALLQLAARLIDTARADAGAPAPVVLNLSSFRPLEQDPAEWVVREIAVKYSLPRATARRWLERDRLILLLDALDEMPPDARAECIEALNRFRDQHAAAMVVSTRTEEYAATGRRLRFGAAVTVLPLDDERLDTLLASRGGPLLARSVRENEDLRALVRNPLMLRLLTARGPGDSFDGTTPDEVIHRYVRKCLAGTESDGRRRTLDALRWIARAFERRGTSDLWLEALDPSWLERPAHRRGATWCGILLIVVGTSAVCLSVGFSLGRSTPVLAILTLCPPAALAVLTRGFRPEPVEALSYSWRRAVKDTPRNLLMGVALATVLAVVRSDWRTSFVLVLFASAMLSVVAGLTPSQRAARVHPNEGIWRATRHAAVISLVFGPAIGSIYAYAIWPHLHGSLANDVLSWADPRIPIAITVTTFCMVIIAGRYGAVTALRHAGVRSVLGLRTPLPWNLVAFLDDAVERGLLRRVGGGYMFLHRKVQEHLAESRAEQS